MSWFLLSLILGIYLLFIGFYQDRAFRFSNKFMPKAQKVKDKKHKNQALPAKASLFENIYTKADGIKRQGAITLIICVVLMLVINALFLNFNVLLPIVLGVGLGIYMANFLHARAVKEDFERNFPEALVILNGAISAGSNINQALKDCADAIEGVLHKELKMIVRSLEIGDDAQKVFEASYKRLPFKSYYFFLTALSVSLNSGARLKEILSRLASSTTKAKAIEKKKDAMTSEARMSSKITAAIPFVFLFAMKFISPENFEFIMHDDRGRYILYYFLGSECIGMLIIMFLMRKI